MPPPLVSIIINNYNYGAYVAQAIESALAQTHRPLEVIVVDDGSTDASRAVIQRYASRVRIVFKDNGGQASAFNHGFARSQGEAVIFLDADDTLRPGLAAEVAAALQANPQAAKVVYRLEVVDAAGVPTGQATPPWSQRLPAGDLRAQLCRFPDDLPWPPTSGNAFAARVLRQLLPMPEADYTLCADYYLSNLAALFGPVVALPMIGGQYRQHGANLHHAPGLDLEQTRSIIRRTLQTHTHLRRVAAALGLPGLPADDGAVPAVTFLAHRLVSLRLDPRRHPLPDDTAWSLAWQGVAAALGRLDLSWPARGLRAAWFVAALAAPRPIVRRLAQRFFHPPAGRAAGRRATPRRLPARERSTPPTPAGLR